MKFRWDDERSLLWAGERSYPATFSRTSMHDIPEAGGFLADHPDYRMEGRNAWVYFENGWKLSTIWGDATYSSNRLDMFSWTHPFIEEPELVEVGLLPPERGLWGEPFGYVNVPEYHDLCDHVMLLPHDVELPEGEWDDIQGFIDLLLTTGMERAM